MLHLGSGKWPMDFLEGVRLAARSVKTVLRCHPVVDRETAAESLEKKKYLKI